MSFRFQPSNRNQPPIPPWSCNLQCNQCQGQKKDGMRCSRNTCKYLPYCFQHLKSVLGLAVKPSTIPNAGLGLFATREIPNNTNICEFEGARLNENQMNERYGDDTSPYAYKLRGQGQYIDPACRRGVGAYANHAPIAGIVGRRANARWMDYQKNGVWHMRLRSTHPIHTGNEILVRYADNMNHYWAGAQGTSYATRPHKIKMATY